MKMGAPKSDRIYEEITDKKKLNHMLSEVKYLYINIYDSLLTFVHFLVLG